MIVGNESMQLFDLHVLYIAIINYLLSQHAMIDKQDNNGNNVLHLALLHSHSSCAKLLLKESTELIIQQNRHNQTPLNVLNSIRCSRNMIMVMINMMTIANPFLILRAFQGRETRSSRILLQGHSFSSYYCDSSS